MAEKTEILFDKAITEATGLQFLWDEILKYIINKMPEQLLPLIKEIFGKDYPKDTKITLLSTEYSKQNKNGTLSAILTDITILVNDNDVYHIECQIKNDGEMVIRMVEYDFHIALQHGKYEKNGMYTIEFPNSVVIYPALNKKIPDQLACRLLFPDGSSHIYKVPTVKIQSYSLEQIQNKHLILFLPYTLLRFAPRLKSKRQPLTKNELTTFVQKIIVVLESEKAHGNISEVNYRDIVNLINLAAEKIFCHKPDYSREVLRMTASKIKLPSDYIEEMIQEQAKEIAKILAEERARELAKEIAKELAEEKAKELAEEKAKELAEEKAKELAEERAKELAEKIAKELAEEKAKELVKEMMETKDNEIARLTQLLLANNIAIPKSNA